MICAAPASCWQALDTAWRGSHSSIVVQSRTGRVSAGRGEGEGGKGWSWHTRHGAETNDRPALNEIVTLSSMAGKGADRTREGRSHAAKFVGSLPPRWPTSQHKTGQDVLLVSVIQREPEPEIARDAASQRPSNSSPPLVLPLASHQGDAMASRSGGEMELLCFARRPQARQPPRAKMPCQS
jgi:hypothetical protein